MDYTLSTRSERYSFELLDFNRNHVAWLDGESGGEVVGNVIDCSLEWSIYNSIRCSGSMSVRTREFVNWQRYLVRPHITVESNGESETTPLATCYIRYPNQVFNDHGVTTPLELYDRTYALAETLPQNFQVFEGEHYTNAIQRAINIALNVGAIIWPAGSLIVDSDRISSKQMYWNEAEANDLTYLRVINDICDLIGYRAIYCDALGTFRAEPYVEPGQRPTTWRLADDRYPHQRYSADGIEITSSTFDSYNQWQFYRRVEGDEPVGEFAIAINNDPNHPFSVYNTGILRTDLRTDVEAGSIAILQEMVNRAKAEAMADQRTFGLSARYFPVVEDEVVELVNKPASLVTKASVSSRSLNLSPGEKMTMRLREVTNG